MKYLVVILLMISLQAQAPILMQTLLRVAVNSARASLKDSLVAYWKLDEEESPRMDSVGSRHLYEEGASGEVIAYPGVIGDAADYYTASYGLLADSFQATLPAEFSVSMWVYSPATDYLDWIMMFHLWGPTEAEVFRIQAYPPYAQYYIGQSSAWGVFEDGGIYFEQSWTHLVVTVSATTAKMYANGVLHQTWSVTTAQLGYAQLRIGGNYLGYPFVGRIDEVGMWERLLSAAEVSQLYNSGSGLAYELF